MTEGKGEYEWRMTANLIAVQVNMQLKPGAKRVDPEEINPFVKRKTSQVLTLSKKESMKVLKQAFLK